MAGTIFMDTRTPLRSWFHAVFLMASTRCGISAKQLQREIGVTYKTAWRMFKQIRTLLAEPENPQRGPFELDETYVGGRRRGGARGRSTAGNKTAVFGVAHRPSGTIVAKTVPDVKMRTLMPHIEKHVMPASTIYTDEFMSYNQLGRQGYHHRRVNHTANVWVAGHAHTNTLEGFWSLLKRSITGANHSVSAKYLQSYLDEYTYRYNHRNDEAPMFLGMLHQVEKA
jgi:transposase-like protein